MISLTEEFDNPQGKFVNYDTNDITLYDEFKDHRHIDLRSIVTQPVTVPYNMFRLIDIMVALDAKTVGALEQQNTIYAGEPWTSSGIGTITTNTIVNMKPALTITPEITFGAGLARSVGTNIDLSSCLPTDRITLSCPSYPTGLLDLTNSYVTVTKSDSTNVYLFFSNATINITSGNAEISWPISALGSNPSCKTFAIEIRKSSGSPVLTVNAIRVLPANWTAQKIDSNTVLKRLEPTVNKNGTIPTTSFPHVWRAADPPGEDDPRPFNSRLSVNFFTGASVSSNSTIKLFTRGRREDFLTQLDLDGTNDGSISAPPTVGQNQWSLEQKKRQPDYGQAVYNSRAQSDLDSMVQSDLSYQPPTDTSPPLTQAQLERISDTISESWIEVTLTWSSAGAKVVVGTTETTDDDDRYIFDSLILAANTRYVLLFDTVDTYVRVQIIPVLATGELNYAGIVFDSYQLMDDFIFPRRKGRIGYWADLVAPSSWIDSVRTRGLMFGEFLTNTYESITPVTGAQVFSGGTDDLILTQGLQELGYPTLEIDTHNTQSLDGSLKVTTVLGSGIQSVLTDIQDFANTEVHFDIYFSKTALLNGTELDIGLFGTSGSMFSLILPQLVGDQWQHCRIPLTKVIDQQTGGYNFFLAASAATTFWIDNFKIVQKTVTWSGRAAEDNVLNAFGDSWVNFNQMINSDSVGALFAERGKSLQIRGQTLTSNAHIDKMYVKPKYAELGRIIWDVNRKYI